MQQSKAFEAKDKILKSSFVKEEQLVKYESGTYPLAFEGTLFKYMI